MTLIAIFFVLAVLSVFFDRTPVCINHNPFHGLSVSLINGKHVLRLEE